MSYDPGGPTSVLSMPRIPGGPPNRRNLVLGVLGGAVLAILLLIYLVLVFTTGNKVPGGTTVAGVDIGGLDRGAAENKLHRDLSDRATKPLELTAADDKKLRLDPAKAGLKFDEKATVDKVYRGTDFNPISLIGSLGGGEATPPVIDVDRAKLDEAIGKLAKQIDRKPVEGAITFKGGKAQVVVPKEGYELQQADAANTIQSSFLVTTGAIGLPTADTATALTADDVQAAMQTIAEPAMSGPVKLKVGDGSISATPKEIGDALTLQATEGQKLAPVIDGKKLLATLDDKLDGVIGTPKDAKIEMSGGRPKVVPSKSGHSVTPTDLSAAIVPVLGKAGDQRIATVKTVKKEADVTTAELEGLGVDEVVGSFTTRFPYARYRNINIGRASELINGTLVLPGKSFSLNDTVGERTAANGFVGGYTIQKGVMKIDLGGGVSQVATTTYNAAFFAGMRDVEHRPHGFYISRYPEGREATVFWGSLDLKWKNTTPYAVYVQSYTNEASPGGRGSVTVKLWSTKYYKVETKTSERYGVVPFKTIEDDRKEHCVDQPEGMDGFQVDVYRYLYRNGDLVKTEKDHVKYNPEDKIKCKYPTDPPD